MGAISSCVEEFSDTFASFTLPCEMPFCHTAQLLPSVTAESEENSNTELFPTAHIQTPYAFHNSKSTQRLAVFLH